MYITLDITSELVSLHKTSSANESKKEDAVQFLMIIRSYIMTEWSVARHPNSHLPSCKEFHYTKLFSPIFYNDKQKKSIFCVSISSSSNYKDVLLYLPELAHSAVFFTLWTSVNFGLRSKAVVIISQILGWLFC